MSLERIGRKEKLVASVLITSKIDFLSSSLPEEHAALSWAQ